MRLKALGPLAGVAAFFAFLFALPMTQPATRLALNDRCEPDGLLDQGRAVLQRRYFWRGQLAFVGDMVRSADPRTRSSLYHLADSVISATRWVGVSTLSGDRRQADSLRVVADSIDDVASRRDLDRLNAEQAEKYRACLAIVRRKAE